MKSRKKLAFWQKVFALHLWPKKVDIGLKTDILIKNYVTFFSKVSFYHLTREQIEIHPRLASQNLLAKSSLLLSFFVAHPLLE